MIGGSAAVKWRCSAELVCIGGMVIELDELLHECVLSSGCQCAIIYDGVHMVPSSWLTGLLSQLATNLVFSMNELKLALTGLMFPFRPVIVLELQ